MRPIADIIAQELNVKQAQVDAAISLLNEGSTVPFISRYRKEATGGLDDTQLRQLNERLAYLRELNDRRTSILASIEEQGKLTPALKKDIEQADSKTRLEDLYLPYKKKRRTKGEIAKEAGLEPLADAIMADFNLVPEEIATKYINAEHEINDSKTALDGAKFILMERFAEQADLLAKLRTQIVDNGSVISSVMKDKEESGEKFRDYFEYQEEYAKVPPHRALALFRGRKESVLSIKLDIPGLGPKDPHPCEATIADNFSTPYAPGGDFIGKPAATAWLTEVVRWTWRVKLLLQIENDLLGKLRELAEAEAIKVFADNLKDVLLASPAGQRATIGLDPGLRTGVKVAVIDSTGQPVDNSTIYPHAPQKKWNEAVATLSALAKKYNIELLAIGNGTASRETEKLAAEVISKHPELPLSKVVVSEAGASIYSASEFAAKEFPDLDVTVRGAISIARRLQDPLAELVKIDPQSIGVGQYQHDVSQFKLAKSLDAVVEDCVNAVGVEVNTASAALLSRVAGLNDTQANNIVEWRNSNGPFASREQLRSVPRLGDKTFEQAAGFLRIHNGAESLDASAVHPESYKLVQQMASDNSCEVRELMSNKPVLKLINASKYVSESIGLPTVQDIIVELDKPGRDPRPEFQVAQFKEGIEKLSDLEEDMILEGSVTNVTNFGAFVDIGVHQDGLVHISALSNKFIKDPREVVKTGDIVKVKVMAVDVKRKRIGLSMRLDDCAAEQADNDTMKQRRDKQSQNRPSNNKQKSKGNQHGQRGSKAAAAPSALAAAFANAKTIKR